MITEQQFEIIWRYLRWLPLLHLSSFITLCTYLGKQDKKITENNNFWYCITRYLLKFWKTKAIFFLLYCTHTINMFLNKYFSFKWFVFVCVYREDHLQNLQLFTGKAYRDTHREWLQLFTGKAYRETHREWDFYNDLKPVRMYFRSKINSFCDKRD